MKQLLIFSLFILSAFLQDVYADEADNCGFPPTGLKSSMEVLGDNWGYSYDSLLADIAVWETNEFVSVQSIGKSVQGREIYELTITDASVSDVYKQRIYIHARTHPNEVQSFHVTDEMIRFAMEDSDLGASLRELFIFHFVPMYNPDGVELEYDRQNANNIDIESNWGAGSVQEAEVVALRARFESLMSSDVPISVALNMHSAYACNRYFVYHHPNGTSETFAQKEQNFIGAVQSYYPAGIKPFDHVESWSESTPTQYPESWWWFNYGEDVLALTYEDMNCSSAGNYSITAHALLNGIVDYTEWNAVFTGIQTSLVSSVDVFPNPTTGLMTVRNHSATALSFQLMTASMTKAELVPNLIRELNGAADSFSEVQLDISSLPAGIYYLIIHSVDATETVLVDKL